MWHEKAELFQPPNYFQTRNEKHIVVPKLMRQSRYGDGMLWALHLSACWGPWLVDWTLAATTTGCHSSGSIALGLMIGPVLGAVGAPRVSLGSNERSSDWYTWMVFSMLRHSGRSTISVTTRIAVWDSMVVLTISSAETRLLYVYILIMGYLIDNKNTSNEYNDDNDNSSSGHLNQLVVRLVFLNQGIYCACTA